MIIQTNSGPDIWEGTLGTRKYRVVWKNGWPKVDYSDNTDHVGQPRWMDAEDGMEAYETTLVMAAALHAKIEKSIVQETFPAMSPFPGPMVKGPAVISNGTATRAMCDRGNQGCERTIDVPDGADPDAHLSDAGWYVEDDATHCPSCRDPEPTDDGEKE